MEENEKAKNIPWELRNTKEQYYAGTWKIELSYKEQERRTTCISLSLQLRAGGLKPTATKTTSTATLSRTSAQTYNLRHVQISVNMLIYQSEYIITADVSH